MSPEEIVRRLRVLREMPNKERPVKFLQLQKMTGIRRDNIHRFLRDGHLPNAASAAQLSRALEEVASRGKQVLWTRIRITPNGPVLDFVPVNTLEFPVLPEINK